MTGTPLIELRHRGGFLVSLANGHRSFDQGTVLNNTGAVLQYQAGTVMAKQPNGNWAPVIRAGVVGSLLSTTTLASGAGFAAIPVVSAASGQGGQFGVTMQAVSVAPDGGAITSSYQPNDIVTLAGGTASTPVQVAVTNTALYAAGVNAPGTGFAPGDTIAPKGGTQAAPAQLTVASTKVVSATIASPGTGGTNGAQVVTGTTGTGTKFQANVTVAGGAITAVQSIALGGAYTANPAAPANEPVTGGGLAGAALNLVMGVNAVTVSNGGVFAANAAALTFGSTSGTGAGASFNNLLFAPNALSPLSGGAYAALPATPVAQASTSGAGAGAGFAPSWGVLAVSASGGAGYDQGDAIVFAGGAPTTPAAGFVNVNTAGDLVAAGILYDTLYIPATATSVTSAIVTRTAEVNASELIWDPSLGVLDITAALGQLAALAIIAR